MTKRKKLKKLQRDQTSFRIVRAADFPDAPGLLARMRVGDIYIEKKFSLPKG